MLKIRNFSTHFRIFGRTFAVPGGEKQLFPAASTAVPDGKATIVLSVDGAPPLPLPSCPRPLAAMQSPLSLPLFQRRHVSIAPSTAAIVSNFPAVRCYARNRSFASHLADCSFTIPPSFERSCDPSKCVENVSWRTEGGEDKERNFEAKVHIKTPVTKVAKDWPGRCLAEFQSAHTTFFLICAPFQKCLRREWKCLYRYGSQTGRWKGWHTGSVRESLC